jgi:flagellar biogenesis protein FliO
MKTIESSATVARVIWLALLLFGCANAAAATHATQPVPLQTPSLFFSLARVLGALALVTALFFAGVWLFRNWQRVVLQKGRPPKLNLIEVRSLGARHALYLIGYQEQRYLISTSPAGIGLLAQLPDAQNEPLDQNPRMVPANFGDVLFKAVATK